MWYFVSLHLDPTTSNAPSLVRARRTRWPVTGPLAGVHLASAGSPDHGRAPPSPFQYSAAQAPCFLGWQYSRDERQKGGQAAYGLTNNWPWTSRHAHKLYSVENALSPYYLPARINTRGWRVASLSSLQI